MQTELIKLAPTLSAKERAKILLTDYHKKLVNGRGVLSEPERTALLYFEDRKIWKEYTHYTWTYKWVHIMWGGEMKNLSILILGLFMYLGGWQIFLATGEDTAFYNDKEIKSTIRALELLIKKLLNHREALKILEQELDLVPLLNGKTHSEIEEYWISIESSISKYNKVFEILERPLIDGNFEYEGYKYCKSIIKNKEQFLITKSLSDKEAVNQLVQEMKELVAKEVDILNR